jgi:hypothetical protein
MEKELLLCGYSDRLYPYCIVIIILNIHGLTHPQAPPTSSTQKDAAYERRRCQAAPRSNA